jgi:hypothetical protein
MNGIHHFIIRFNSCQQFLIFIACLLCLVPVALAQTQADKLRNPELVPPKPMRPGTAYGPAGYIVLVPLDDRPAVAQFAQMIGAIADHRVVMPPVEMLGRFTRPGDTRMIDAWLRAQDYSRVDALIVSVDMLAYGGLVASRVPHTSISAARKQLEFFQWFKKTWPKVPLYAFNVLMRVAPTASAESRNWSDKLARWAELKDRAPKTGEAKLTEELRQLEKKLDRQRINEYLAARKRDLQIHLAMLDLVKAGIVDSLILLQDDARQYGLHRQDQQVLHGRLQKLGLTSKVPIDNGADEASLSLVSRAILDKFQSSVKVSVVYSSEKSRQVIAPDQDHPIQFTVENQIRAAGGRIIENPDEADYVLYVNAPQTTDAELQKFFQRMVADAKFNRPFALADILFPAPHYSGADERVIEFLNREKMIDRLAGYAACNTAGNTLGTTIPAANLRVFFKTRLTDGLAVRAARAEAAHLEFLLHRFAGDHLYHDIVRLEINRELRRDSAILADEFPPDVYARVNREVESRLRPLMEKFFSEHFQNKKYTLPVFDGTRHVFLIKGLKGLKIYLPWPRTFEATIEYKLDYEISTEDRPPEPGNHDKQ